LLGLLIKDLDINDNGALWVFILDKQKVHLILVDIVSYVYSDDLVFSLASNILMMTLSLVERSIFNEDLVFSQASNILMMTLSLVEPTIFNDEFVFYRRAYSIA
jgi:hypothetical protein